MVLLRLHGQEGATIEMLIESACGRLRKRKPRNRLRNVSMVSLEFLYFGCENSNSGTNRQ
jgi:hypothetical protein